ncbi:hypothetical protein Pla52n_00030 [Stieleria varia]|uniref:Uncharacterized protein n=1 Tax=Stieleria varia TaxID=2528005 RepID=A0A5C6B648_9BACT|nr:hypothetical protein Pla52n_00030 [Stieleria varia]
MPEGNLRTPESDLEERGHIDPREPSNEFCSICRCLRSLMRCLSVGRGADAPRFMLSLPPQLEAVTRRGSFLVRWSTSIGTFDQRSKVLCPPDRFLRTLKRR